VPGPEDDLKIAIKGLQQQQLLLHDRLNDIEQLVVENQTRMQKHRRESFKHRQLLESGLWAVSGLVLIVLIGYKSENWNVDTPVLRELIGFATIAASIYKVYQAGKTD